MAFNINALTLSATPRDFLLARQALAAADDAAAVGDGQATAFVTGLSEQNKQDVMNSTLLAQLAASGQYDRFRQTTEWYTQYKYVLENVGWIVSNFKFDEHHLDNVDVSVDKIILDFLKTYLDSAQLALMERVIAALEKSTDPAVNIFQTAAKSDTQANFQLGNCTEDRDKNVMFSIGAFTYSTNQRITNVIFTKIKNGSAKFLNAFQNMTLNKQVYGTVRQAVIEKLGQNAKDLIKDLVLPPRK